MTNWFSVSINTDLMEGDETARLADIAATLRKLADAVELYEAEDTQIEVRDPKGKHVGTAHFN